ncbi:MAG: hypothetical protein ACTHU0_17360 [Kofleriaceae bacterium]
MTDLHKLRNKLCRELAQSEHDAKLHPAREARRLGDVPPAHSLLRISEHAEELRPRFEALMQRKHQRRGMRLGRTVGSMFSALRHAIFDRMIDSERAFRATLLGLRHGLDCARLLRDVAAREGDSFLVRFCDELLVERSGLLEDAEQTLSWFADCPSIALRAGRIALEPGAARS